MKTILDFLLQDDGASAAEYALILAIVGAAIAVGCIALGSAIGNAVNRASNCITVFTAAACS